MCRAERDRNRATTKQAERKSTFSSRSEGGMFANSLSDKLLLEDRTAVCSFASSPRGQQLRRDKEKVDQGSYTSSRVFQVTKIYGYARRCRLTARSPRSDYFFLECMEFCSLSPLERAPHQLPHTPMCQSRVKPVKRDDPRHVTTTVPSICLQSRVDRTTLLFQFDAGMCPRSEVHRLHICRWIPHRTSVVLPGS